MIKSVGMQTVLLGKDKKKFMLSILTKRKFIQKKNKLYKHRYSAARNNIQLNINTTIMQLSALIHRSKAANTKCDTSDNNVSS